jgi:phage terminase large subunit
LIDFDSILDYFNPVHIPEEKEVYLTVDVARKGKDKSVIRVWKGWLCIKRIAIDKNTITELADRVRNLMAEYGVSRSRVVADEDGVGGGLIDILRCKGFVNNSKGIEWRELRQS